MRSPVILAKEQQARRALDIIHYYRMDATCFAGRPYAPMTYLLSSGRSPVGSTPGEQCDFFDPGGISLLHRSKCSKIRPSAACLHPDFAAFCGNGIKSCLLVAGYRLQYAGGRGRRMVANHTSGRLFAAVLA